MTEPWVERVVLACRRYEEPGLTPGELWRQVDAPELDAEEFVAAVVPRLREEPELLEEWWIYCNSIRPYPAPGFAPTGNLWLLRPDGRVYRTKLDDGFEACARFLHNEVAWLRRLSAAAASPPPGTPAPGSGSC